jgi:uncharacterized membrane protein
MYKSNREAYYRNLCIIIIIIIIIVVVVVVVVVVVPIPLIPYSYGFEVFNFFFGSIHNPYDSLDE